MRNTFVLAILMSIRMLSAATPASGVQTPVITPTTPLPTAGPQTLSAGLWRVDDGFVSTIQVKNLLASKPVIFTPALYMADGTEQLLTPIQLPANASTVININTQLQGFPADKAAHISSFGSVSILFNSDPGALIGSITMMNARLSLSYTTSLNGVMSGTPTMQTLEGLWWRHDSGVGGFVGLSNSTTREIAVQIQAVGSQGGTGPVEQTYLPPHSTKMLDLDSLIGSLPRREMREGGLRVQFDGLIGEVNVVGGLANINNGYSAVMPFWMSGMGIMSSTASSTAQVTLAHAGLMTGPADPMMGFPATTKFTPYLALRNTTAQSVDIGLTIYTDNGTPLPATVHPLQPFETRQINMKEVLAAIKLSTFSGMINLAVSHKGQSTDVLQVAGSVDETGTYVFEVPAKQAETSMSKETPYWTVAGGADTMVSLWNPSSEPEDLNVTLYFSAGTGKYVLPVHLNAFSSYNFNISMLIREQKKDASGRVIPLGIFEGSLQFASANSETKSIQLVPNIGIFNVATATCYYGCISCPGWFGATISPGSLSMTVGQSSGLTLSSLYNGISYIVYGSWSGSNNSVASISANGNGGAQVSAASPGTATIYGSFSGQPANSWFCAYNPGCYMISSQSFTANITASVNCNFPTGETSAFYAWADQLRDGMVNSSPAVGEFIQTLTPPANYSGAAIVEGNTSPATDSCWFNGSAYAPVYGVSGGQWIVYSSTQWSPDKIGFSNLAEFYYYQTIRPSMLLPMPCTVTMFQKLTFGCQNNQTRVYENPAVLQITVSGTGITVSREGVTAVRTPLHQ